MPKVLEMFLYEKVCSIARLLVAPIIKSCYSILFDVDYPCW